MQGVSGCKACDPAEVLLGGRLLAGEAPSCHKQVLLRSAVALCCLAFPVLC